jgi:hypothetical protein
MRSSLFLSLIFWVAACSSIRAQTILHATTGSVVTVQAGASLYVNGGVILDNNSTLNNTGTVTIARNSIAPADFIDNTVAPHSYGAGKFILIGTGGSQSIQGSVFYDLEINNAAGVSLLNSETVNNNLFLTNGSLSLGANSLNLNGPVTGTGKLKGSSASTLAIGGSAGTLNFDQTDSTTRSLKDLTFSSGSATLGNAMQVYGLLGLTASAFHINNQSLVLKSVGNGFANTARVGNLTGSIVDGATNVTVERYIASPQRAWHLLSAKAVTGSQTIRQAWQENGGSVIAGQGTLVTSNLYNVSNGFDMVSISSSVLTHNQGGNGGPSWNYNLANTNVTVLSAVQGYMLFVRGDRNYTPANIPATSPTVLRTNGTLTQGNQSVFISSTGAGRTLVANPYASPIDMEPIFAGTVNLAQDMYIWDPALTGNYGVGGFRLVERTGANTYQQTPVVLGGTSPDPTSRYIHSGQAFFLRTTGTSGTTNATVNFTEATKASNVSVVNPLINGINDQQLITNLMIVNPGNIESLADGIRVRFDDSYSATVTDDVEKMGNFAENISSYREAKKLIVEKRPMISLHDTIFLRMTNTGIKDYRFQVGTINFVQAGVVAYLQDTYLSVNSPLDLTGIVNNIDFNVSSDPASAAPDRFRIVFALSTPLPVNFISIRAYPQAANIAVEWKVGSELNIKNYEIERATDGISFYKAGTQPATGNNNNDITYNWLDVNPVPGNNFYRIKSISNSGEIKYSTIVKVMTGQLSTGITVYPNPVTNKEISVQFAGMAKGIYQLRLINTIGQVMFTKLLTVTGGNEIQKIALGNMAAGQYELEITQPGNSRTMKKLMITN